MDILTKKWGQGEEAAGEDESPEPEHLQNPEASPPPLLEHEDEVDVRPNDCLPFDVYDAPELNEAVMDEQALPHNEAPCENSGREEVMPEHPEPKPLLYPSPEKMKPDSEGSTATPSPIAVLSASVASTSPIAVLSPTPASEPSSAGGQRSADRKAIVLAAKRSRLQELKSLACKIQGAALESQLAGLIYLDFLGLSTLEICASLAACGVYICKCLNKDNIILHITCGI